MKVEHIKRKFRFETDNETLELEEISPNMTPEQHRKHYSGLYPSLAISNIEYKGIEDGIAVYEFSEKPGGRG